MTSRTMLGFVIKKQLEGRRFPTPAVKSCGQCQLCVISMKTDGAFTSRVPFILVYSTVRVTCSECELCVLLLWYFKVEHYFQNFKGFLCSLIALKKF